MIQRAFVALSLFSVLLVFGSSSSLAQTRNREQIAVEKMSRLRLAHAYEASRDLENALRVYADLWQLDSNDQEIFGGLSQTLYYLRKFSEAEAVTQSWMSRHEKDFNLLLFLAKLEARLNKPTDAEKYFDEVLKLIGPSDDCAAVLPVVYSMIEVSFNRQALALLKTAEKNAGDQTGQCQSEMANLYLRLGEYGEGAKAYAAILKNDPNSLNILERRLAQFTVDSVSRTAVLGALRTEITNNSSNKASLQLLAWLYGEEKNYTDAYQIILRLDDLATGQDAKNKGYELLNFAERARNEGAIEVAVKAYDEAIKRMKQAENLKNNSYFLSQAELGALRTREKYLLSLPLDTSQILNLIERFQSFAGNAPVEFALDAYLEAGSLATTALFRPDLAEQCYRALLEKSNRFSEPMARGVIGLAETAIATGKFDEAIKRLTSLRRMNSARPSRNIDVEMHVQFLLAKIDYFRGDFDSASEKLAVVTDDPSNDYANDAIQLQGVIDENNTPTGSGALKQYAKAQMLETQHQYTAAAEAFRSINESQPNSGLADNAVLRYASLLVRLGEAQKAVDVLAEMDEKMLKSPLLDEAYITRAQIVEQKLGDKKQAQKLYENFLVRFPKSTFLDTARDSARRLRGDLF